MKRKMTFVHRRVDYSEEMINRIRCQDEMPESYPAFFRRKSMNAAKDFTQGKILSPLIRFMVPVFLAMFLQSMYGAVDLLIVGKFAQSVDVSAVSTGSQIMMTLTNLVTSFADSGSVRAAERTEERSSAAVSACLG